MTKTRRWGTLLVVAAALWCPLLSCSGEENTEPGAGGATSCGDGTELVGGVCQVDDDACGGQTVLDPEQGRCVVQPEDCPEGTSFDQGAERCVADASIFCGVGTESLMGACVPTAAACAEGQAFDEATRRCVELELPDCGQGTMRDPESGRCELVASICGQGTALDPEAGQCVPQESVCGPGTYYDLEVGQCLQGRRLLGSCGQLEALPDRIDEDTTLVSGTCYRLDGTVTIASGSRLDIQPGVLVVAGPGGALVVDGTLRARGRQDSRIVFTGAEETPGSWDGIWWRSATADNRLEHVIVEYAGGDEFAYNYPKAALAIDDGPVHLGLVDVVFRSSGGYGIFVEEAAELAWAQPLSGVRFEENALGAASLRPTDVGHLDATTEFATADQEVVVRRGTVRRSATWPAHAPYRFTGSTTVSDAATLTLEAGSTLRYPAGAFLWLDGGYLRTRGTDAAPVRLTALDETAGGWGGLVVDAGGSPDNLLEGVEILYGGGAAPRYGVSPAGLMILDGGPIKLRVDGAKIEHSAGYGVVVKPGQTTDLGTLQGLSFAGNALGAMQVPADQVGAIGPQASFGADDQVVELRGTVSRDQSWVAGPRYRAVGAVTVANGATLTLEPGLQMWFGQDIGLAVDGGYLRAAGVVGMQVVLQGAMDAPGFWKGLYFGDSEGPNNVLDQVVIAHGGSSHHAYGLSAANLTLDDNSRVTVRGLELRGSGGAGISTGSPAALVDCTGVQIMDTPQVAGDTSDLVALCGM